MNSLKTGELAKQAEVNVETLRFYEREGLLAEPPRRASGYREYPPDTVQRIRFIQRAKELGFTLRQIKGLLELRVDPDTTCAEVKEQAAKKIADVKQKISDLKRIERALNKLIHTCRGSGRRCWHGAPQHPFHVLRSAHMLAMTRHSVVRR